MSVYCINFYVDTPVITNEEIHLDSIFYGICPAAHNKDHVITRQTKSDKLSVLPIPIDCAKNSGGFIYCCTAAEYVDGKAMHDTITKRRDMHDYMYYHKMQTPRTGIDKDCMITLYGVACSSVRFYASTSSRNELERYCRRVKGIGAMRRLGYGHVTDFDVAEIGEDWQRCLVRCGKAERNIPKYMMDNDTADVERCFPPYWLPDGKIQCAKVGEFAELKADVVLSPFRR